VNQFSDKVQHGRSPYGSDHPEHEGSDQVDRGKQKPPPQAHV